VTAVAADGDTGPAPTTTPTGTTPVATGSLQVVASIADSLPPRRGSPPDPLPAAVTGGQQQPAQRIELPPVVSDGRVSQLGPSGWVDRSGGFIETNPGRDLPLYNSPIQAFALSADGTGWAAGGRGAWSSSSTSLSAARGISGAFSTDLSADPLAIADNTGGDVGAAPTPARSREAAVRASSHLRGVLPPRLRAVETTPLPTDPAPTTDPAPATDPAPTTDPAPATTAPADTTPDPAPTTPEPVSNPDAKRVRILVGGHPACLDECTGRTDQRVGPSATLVEAMGAARRLSTAAAESTPISLATIIGGGRDSAGGAPLSVAGADTYADILRSGAGAAPVLPVIGTGDAGGTPGPGRSTFARRVAAPLQPADSASVAAVTGMPSPLAGPDDSTVTFAYDLKSDLSPLRVVGIDNASGGLRGGLSGPQAVWLKAVLEDARTKQIPAIVVGAAALDAKSTLPASERNGELDLLIAGGTSAYVGTDGGDDPNDLTTFGPRTRQDTAKRPSGTLSVIQSAALGHAIPTAMINALNFASDKEYDALREKLADYSTAPSLVALDIDPASRVAQTGQFDVRATEVPIIRGFATEDTGNTVRGNATFVPTAVTIDNDNGIRWTDAAGTRTGDSIGMNNIDASPDQCRLYAPKSECGESLPSDVRFSTTDPDIAVFVRAKRGKPINYGNKTDDTFSVPAVVADQSGNPIIDSSSPVLCPLRAGHTNITMTLSGLTKVIPLDVQEPSDRNSPKQTSTTTASGKPTCAFNWGVRDEPNAAPAPAPAKPAPKPVTVVSSPPHPPATHPSPHHHGPPAVTPLLPVNPTLTVPPVSVFPIGPAQQAAPPVAPNPKPISTMTPTPPSGVSTQQLVQQVPSPASQGLIATVRQEERKTEVAREGADHSATIYKASPRPDATLALLGGALALLVAIGGGISGRRRALARAAIRAWLR
jgi:hypothetical protein